MDVYDYVYYIILRYISRRMFEISSALYNEVMVFKFAFTDLNAVLKNINKDSVRWCCWCSDILIKEYIYINIYIYIHLNK